MQLDKKNIEQINNAARMLPFDNLIGGPLVACVKAQAQAADATRNYIRSLSKAGSTDDSLGVETITFTFLKDNESYELSVPLLTIVPIPYLHIDTIKLNFRANMSVDSNDNLVAKYAVQGNSNIESNQKSNFNIQNQMDVEVLATGNHVPDGLNKVLEVLHGLIKTEEIVQ